MPTSTRAHIPLTLRITHYLRRAAGPRPAAVIARHLHAKASATARACRHLVRRGRLCQCPDGAYTVAEESTP
jgi:DNA-binding IclR family transcriptional regulator